MEPMNIFISYSTKNQIIVDQLCDVLTQFGHIPFTSARDLIGAKHYPTQIQTNIDNCDRFLFAMSQHSLASPHCQKELQHAALTGKPVVPIVVQDINEFDIPKPLDEIQWVFFDNTGITTAKIHRALDNAEPIKAERIPDSWTQWDGNESSLSSSDISSAAIPLPKKQVSLTDLEKDEYLHNSFQILREYFERAVVALEAQDERYTGKVREIHSSKFTCKIFYDGNILAACKLWVSSMLGFDGIAYYAVTNGKLNIDKDNSYNAIYQITEIENEPRFSTSSGTIGISYNSANKDSLTQLEMATAIWQRFIEYFPKNRGQR